MHWFYIGSLSVVNGEMGNLSDQKKTGSLLPPLWQCVEYQLFV